MFTKKLFPNYILIAIGLLLLIKSIEVFASSGKEIDVQGLDNYLTVTVAGNHIQGLAIAFVQDGQVGFQKGYGQSEAGNPLTPQTQFYIGSVSKSFTAMAVMQLVEQGKIDLDAPVRQYLPWFAIADTQGSDQITVRNLLNQTSGLSEQGDPGANTYRPTLREQVDLSKTASLTAPVGQKFQYDSQNYRILSMIVEETSGKTFAEYLEDHIFIPLGMQNTTANPGEFTDLADGYGQMFGYPLPREEEFQPAGIGSGYIVSTAEDMGKYVAVMLNHGQLGDVTLITRDSWETMMTPPEGIGSEYGMGWMVTTMNGEETIYHGGSLTNYLSFAMMLPDKNSGFVFLSNQNGILPMFTFFNALKLDLAKYLADDVVPTNKSFAWAYWLLRAIVLITIGFQVFRITRIRKWMTKSQNQKSWKKWMSVVLDLLIPSVLLGIPLFAKVFLGASSASWLDAYRMLPDVVLWLLIMIGLNLLIGISKLVLVVKELRA